MFNFFKRTPAKVETRDVTSSSIDNYFWGNAKAPGVYGISTSYACIKLLASYIASIPIKQFKTESDERIVQTSALVNLLKQPSPNTSYFEWMRAMVVQLVGKGNAYSLIIRESGKPVELLYIDQSNVQVYITTDSNLPYYYMVTLYGENIKVYPEDMIHFRNISDDSIEGLSPLSTHRLMFDASASINEYNKTFMDNATNISGIITTEGKLSKETVEDLRKNFAKKFGGANNAGKTPVLSNGLKYEQIQVISPLDADYIANRKMNKSDIAEIYGVPLGMVSNTEAKYSNAEQESLNFHQITVTPYLDQISQELSMKLLHRYKERDITLDFAPDRFRLTTSKERSETISLLKNSGIITPNEARFSYGFKKIDGGDKLISSETEQAAPKDTKNTNPVPGTVASLNAKEQRSVEEIEKEIQRLKSHLGRIKVGNG